MKGTHYQSDNRLNITAQLVLKFILKSNDAVIKITDYLDIKKDELIYIFELLDRYGYRRKREDGLYQFFEVSTC